VQSLNDQIANFVGVKARSSVDYVLRTMQQNFTQLSVAADHKANILIGSTLVMLGVVVGNLHNGQVPLAGFVMGGFALLACLCALVCVVPHVTKRRQRQVNAANPFFFGDFDRISAEEYLASLAGVMREDSALYKTIALDLFHQGRVLERKCCYLRQSYQLFFAGLVAAAAVLAAEYLLK
jgi:pycsar effector protein